MTIYPDGWSPLSQLLKPAHGHSIIQWPHSSLARGISHATDTTYTTESGRKKNKQAQTWVSPKCKKGEVFDTFLPFWASVAVTSVYSNKIPTQLPGMLTHPLPLADPASGSAVAFH